jgi:hypothetical protein
MRTNKLLITVLFAFLTVATLGCATTTTKTLDAPKTVVAPEPKVDAPKTAFDLWGGVITVDYETVPPTVYGVALSMEAMSGYINGYAFGSGEILSLEVEEDNYYVYNVPRDCGDTHIIDRIIILKSNLKRDVGFRMNPLENCVLTPKATWWNDPVVRNLAKGREAYKFTLGEDMQFLLEPNIDVCSKFVKKNTD